MASKHSSNTPRRQPSHSASSQHSTVDRPQRQDRGKQPPSTPKKRKPSTIALAIVLAVLIAIVAGGIGYIVWQNAEMQRAAEELKNTPIPETPVANDTPENVAPDNRVENPIDFATLMAENPDIYAWIYIPGTNVNYPIVQNPNDDSFYLDHNDHQEYAAEGAVYSEMQNDKQFTDPVTVLYGHTMNDTSIMFGTLHYFEDPQFFEQNDTMYIYTPTEILTYRIISAYIYDNRHILNSFNFSERSVLQEYFDYVANPSSIISSVRSGTALDAATSRIVQLSTCTSTHDRQSRYIVTGELVDEQETF